MFTNSERTEIIDCLEALGLYVFNVEVLDEPIVYKLPDKPYTLYEINRSEKGIKLNTLFGGEEYSSVKEVVKILKQDWNKENWVYGEDENGEYIDLKQGFE